MSNILYIDAGPLRGAWEAGGGRREAGGAALFDSYYSYWTKTNVEIRVTDQVLWEISRRPYYDAVKNWLADKGALGVTGITVTVY